MLQVLQQQREGLIMLQAFQPLLEADESFPLLNQMKVSVAWIGILLIVSVLVYFTVYGYHVWEKFQNPPDTAPVLERFATGDSQRRGLSSGDSLNEGFADGSESGMNITMCPVASKSYLDMNGRTVCCIGDVASDKCKGETICSLSEGMASLPTCTVWFESYLKEKGHKRCPRTLSRYFESADGKTRGCTNGRLNKDGSGPATLEQPKCMIYPDKTGDEKNEDSCTNQIFLENTVCFPGSSPSNPPIKRLVSIEHLKNISMPPIVLCSYYNVTKNNNTTVSAGAECRTNESFLRLAKSFENYTKLNGGQPFSVDQWKNSSKDWDPVEKLNFCSIAQRYSIDKTVSFKELPTISVF
jgi:hypothetical protein